MSMQSDDTTRAIDRHLARRVGLPNPSAPPIRTPVGLATHAALQGWKAISTARSTKRRAPIQRALARQGSR